MDKRKHFSFSLRNESNDPLFRINTDRLKKAFVCSCSIYEGFVIPGLLVSEILSFIIMFLDAETGCAIFFIACLLSLPYQFSHLNELTDVDFEEEEQND